MKFLHPRKKGALNASEELSHSPIIAGALSNTSKHSPPPPHSQLLSCETVSYEDLTGYDHTQEVVSYENLYDTPNGYGVTSEDSSFPFCEKLSTVKKESGGSWLLGFTRLREHKHALAEEEEGLHPPGLLCDESDEELSSDSEDEASASEEEALVSEPLPKRRGVSFDTTVVVQPIPHCSALSPTQQRRMYCSTLEVKQNKARNRKEQRYEGYDWRNATEEWEMDVDMLSGELIHPAHEEVLAHPVSRIPDHENEGN